MVAGICCLLCNFAHVNIADERGDTALSLALRFRQEDLAMLLLEHNANFPSSIN
ncbi:MAG: hypothetical protein LAP61_23145 [Acidobacteriia bacterium]|nr:hypothetical protein [Terriglobia bacterium]